MAAGKIKIIVDEKNFVGSTDPLRAIAKKYWTRERGSSFKILNTSFDSETGTEISSNGLPFDINFVGKTNRIESARFYEFEQKIVLKANQNRVDNESDPSTAWESLVGELFGGDISGLSNTYYDHAFSIDLPYTENELKLLNITQKVSSANVKPEYNFYIEGYEEKIQKQKVPELALPNLYALKLAEIQGTEEQFIQDSDLDGLVTMGGLVTADLNTVLQQRRHPREDIGTVSEKPNHAYHKDIVNNYAAMASKKKTTLDRILKRASTISLGNDVVENMGEWNEKQYAFPMYNNVEFSTDTATYVAEILRDSGLNQSLMNYVLDPDRKKHNNTLSLAEAHRKIEVNTLKELESNSKTKTIFKVKSFPSFDLLDWWEKSSNSNKKMPGITISESLLQSAQDEHASMRSSYMQGIYDTVFQSKFRKFIKNYTRTYKSVLNGDMGYSETLMYRIDKYMGEPKGSPIQSYYMCNSNDIDVMSIYDTQVKYDTEYTYVITAYQLVLGTEYHYKDVITGSSAGASSTEYYASLTVVTRPSVRVVEVPIYAEKERIIDDPPIAPDINIIPYRAINNRLLFNFMGNVGEYDLHPVSFTEEERRHYEKIRIGQKRLPKEPLRFSSDDPASVFEVFRLTERPKSYMDFKGAKRASVLTDVSKQTIQKASTAAYIEHLSPNTKYYYIFRSIDVHNHISYPSAVYEVELVDDAGTVYPLIKTVDFEPEIKKTSTKYMKKYIHIIPSLSQALVNPEKSGLMDDYGNIIESALLSKNNIQLGFQESPIWGKRFKVRLTSRQTGRKIDLNLNFTYKHKTTDEDYNSGDIVEKVAENPSKVRARTYYKKKSELKVEQEDLLDLL